VNASAMPRIAPDQAGDRSALAGRLVVLGTQMLRLAGELSRREAAGEAADLPADSALLSLLAEDLYRDRRRRARHLPDRLLGEPAWDILLDLYVAAGRGQAVSVSNACLSADAPASTALRWLQHLEREGLVVRLPDPTDARRHYVRLTESGLARMTAYFAECRGDLVGEVGFGEKALRLES
jgi:DNA-binding MarR family transcriptional regulator